MSWITTSDIESYTGSTIDSGDIATWEDVIDAVCAYINCYCDTDFNDALYSQRVSIVDNHFSLKNRLQYFYGVSYGNTTAMTVVPPSNISSIRISEDGTTLSLIDGFSTTDISIGALTISEVVTDISNEVGWTATINSNIDNDYARTLYNGSFRSNPNDDNTITLLCANTHLDNTQMTDYLFQTGVECDEAMAVYQGGYETIPADLKDVTIRMTIAAYNTKSGSTSADQIKSEKVGDWSETKFTPAELSQGVTGVSIDYKAVLDCYIRQSI